MPGPIRVNSKHHLPNGKGLNYFWHKISMFVFVYRKNRSRRPIEPAPRLPARTACSYLRVKKYDIRP